MLAEAADCAGGTRTCIHTPGPPFREEDLTDGLIDALLSKASLVSFDGRLTEAAINVASAARQRGVPVLVEAERVRPHLEGLLPLADYVITSAHYPEVRDGSSILKVPDCREDGCYEMGKGALSSGWRSHT